MKSRTKPALRAVPAATVQLTLPVQGVLKDVRSAFYGLCIQAGKEVLAAMMEADGLALCGPGACLMRVVARCAVAQRAAPSWSIGDSMPIARGCG